MKNFDEKSIIFIFALSAIIVISYLPANAEEMDESTKEQMKTTMNEMEETMMKEWESMTKMKEMNEMEKTMMNEWKSMMAQKEAMIAKSPVHSPLKQMAMGTAGKDVVCKAGYDLVMRSSGKAACCTPSTAMKLESQGWGTIEKTAEMMEKEHGKMMMKEKEMMDKESMMKGMMNKMDEAIMTEWESMMDAKEMMAQAAETSTTVSEEMMDEDSMMKMGEFVGLAGHSGEGTAKIIDGQDGTTYLRFEDFTVTNGPDLFVYIAQDGDVKNGINLGRLKGSMGNQNYELPENTDLEMYNTAVVYCKLFGVYFAEAPLM